MDSTLRMMNSLKGPDWRWKLAQRLAAEESLEGDVISLLAAKRNKKSQALQDAVGYLRGQAAGQTYDQLSAQYPHLVAALDLHLSLPASEPLKLYVLAGTSRARIARSCSVKVEIVRVWEQLFFDVRPLLKN